MKDFIVLRFLAGQQYDCMYCNINPGLNYPRFPGADFPGQISLYTGTV